MNTLLTACQHARMLANGTANAKHIAEDGNTQDFWPVVKLFCPWGAATWLLSELDPEDEDIAFGLCDPGFVLPLILREGLPMHIIAAIFLIAVAAYAANVTGNIDAVGWVLLGAPFVIPVGMLVLWLTGKLFGAIFGGTRRD